VAGSRILVHSSIYDDVCTRVAEVARGIRVGMPTEATSQKSTLINKGQRDQVDGLVAAGSRDGGDHLASSSSWRRLTSS
jgi:phenylacetaldehyde dehydrogenase